MSSVSSRDAVPGYFWLPIYQLRRERHSRRTWTRFFRRQPGRLRLARTTLTRFAMCLFERFRNTARDHADIDVDFCIRGRPR